LITGFSVAGYLTSSSVELSESFNRISISSFNRTGSEVANEAAPSSGAKKGERPGKEALSENGSTATFLKSADQVKGIFRNADVTVVSQASC
jgi:hypothetical protein